MDSDSDVEAFLLSLTPLNLLNMIFTNYTNVNICPTPAFLSVYIDALLTMGNKTVNDCQVKNE